MKQICKMNEMDEWGIQYFAPIYRVSRESWYSWWRCPIATATNLNYRLRSWIVSIWQSVKFKMCDSLSFGQLFTPEKRSPSSSSRHIFCARFSASIISECDSKEPASFVCVSVQEDTNLSINIGRKGRQYASQYAANTSQLQRSIYKICNIFIFIICRTKRKC